ncbi:hypothetical protein ABIE08_002110 [Kaistia defluvii]|uniref:RiPP n=1 Tax=Kaistia defluvii TaxID=410841 RepID=A0ABV2QYW7_9HYPH
MKKTYEKPALVKSALLQRIAAEPIQSGLGK